MRRDFQGEVLFFQPPPTVKPRQTSIKIKGFKVNDDLCSQPYKRGCTNIFFIRQIVVYSRLNHHCFLGCVFFFHRQRHFLFFLVPLQTLLWKMGA